MDKRFLIRSRNLSPWKRKRPLVYGSWGIMVNHFEEFFDSNRDDNIDLDIETKLSALKVSNSVVALSSYTGEKLLFVCSGTIIECQESGGTFIATVLTSATLLRGHSADTSLDSDIRVYLHLSDRKSYKGEVSAYDFHYNLAVVRFMLEVPHSTVFSGSFQLEHHSCNVVKGDKVIALGRHYIAHELMVAPGVYSNHCSNLDCDELYGTSCKITVTGIGGPLINHCGEILGVNFFETQCASFLPINVVSKCLKHFKSQGRIPRHWLGMKAISISAAGVSKLEKVISKFPNVRECIMVEKVISGSPVESAGLCPDDIIIQCNGLTVGCPFEFFAHLLDKVEQSMELVVMRTSTGSSLNLTVVADEIGPHQCNRWPVPKARREWTDSMRDSKLPRQSVA